LPTIAQRSPASGSEGQEIVVIDNQQIVVVDNNLRQTKLLYDG